MSWKLDKVHVFDFWIYNDIKLNPLHLIYDFYKWKYLGMLMEFRQNDDLLCKICVHIVQYYVKYVYGAIESSAFISKCVLY